MFSRNCVIMTVFPEMSNFPLKPFNLQNPLPPSPFYYNITWGQTLSVKGSR